MGLREVKSELSKLDKYTFQNATRTICKPLEYIG